MRVSVPISRMFIGWYLGGFVSPGVAVTVYSVGRSDPSAVVTSMVVMLEFRLRYAM